MRVVDAYWEKRNLGVDTKEIICDIEDTVAELKMVLDDIQATYVVVKIPTGRNDLTECVQQNRYNYVEDMIEMTHDLHEIVRSRLHQRLYDAMSYRQMTQDDIEQLYKEIEFGLFDSDRISGDSKFSREQSAKRYCNWIRDLIDNKALPYVILYKEVPAGFIVLTTGDGRVYQSVLGGGYAKFRNSGLGIVQKEQEIVKKLGGKRLETHVSTNNPAQLKALCMNGYLPGKIEHVFVRHFV